jgi:UDP-N-acetylmuramyl pentapeptide phosphotransferase/UDP-N-acetylglucosamine-1-phosphate transferase
LTEELAGGLLAAAVTAALTATVLPVLRHRRILDHPDHRTSHTTATPRGGGLAFIGALVAVALAVDGWHDRVGAAVAGATAGAWALGAAEDLRGIRAAVRLAVQLAVGGLAIGALSGAFDTVPVVVAAALGALWFAATVNAVNFMDGINGISGAFAVVAGTYFAWLGHDAGVPALAAGGALLAGVGAGFLPFNMPVARVFMGDAGSYFLGALASMLAATALLATDEIVPAVAPLVYYLVDTGTTMLARWRRGERLTAPHREHAYQRLVAAGWSHTAVTAVAAGVMAAGAAAGAVARRHADEPAVVVLAGVAMLIAAFAVTALGTAVGHRTSGSATP